MPTIFTRIISGEIPCYKIYEDELTFAFLDIRPLQLGHTLVVPKIEVDELYELPEPYFTAVHQTAQKIANALKQATWCVRIGSLVLGMEVPHAHLHLVPMNHESDIDLSNANTETPEAMKEIQEKIVIQLS
jgi:histidine triad (HIT) family protein